MLEQAHQIRTRQELRDPANRHSSIAARSMPFMDFIREPLALFFLPCGGLLSGNQSGACAARNLPPFKKPPGAVRIGSESAGIAAQPAIYLLNHHWVGKVHRPLDAMNRKRHRRTVSPMCRDESDTATFPAISATKP